MKIYIFILSFLCSSLQAQQNYPDSLNNKHLAIAITTQSSFYFGGISYLGLVWYKDVDRVPFHFYNDNAGYLQIDKLGHSFGAYIESKTSYHLLRSAGLSKQKALLYGGSMGFIMQAPIEIFDGIFKGWGFSWGDVLANTAGSVLFVGQELLWDEQIVNYKFSFRRSIYAGQSNGMLGDNNLESLFLDYNGHTYWLSGNLGKLNRFTDEKYLPEWLNLAVGYSANGMFGEFENRNFYRGVQLPKVERHRQYFVSLDIDWTKIKTDKYWLCQIFRSMNYVKLPFPTLEWNQIDGFKGHWIYF